MTVSARSPIRNPRECPVRRPSLTIISCGRSRYQFTRAFSLRAIVDVNLVLANSQLVNLDETKRVTTDILFTYLLHPGTAIYVGYNDTRENLGFDSLGGIARVNSPALTTQRQFFIKASYLFRF